MPPRARTQPRKKASQERSKATVDAILDATARILVKEGYDRASTNRVALAAGVSVGSLYQYFPSKEALVAALVERHMEETQVLVLEAFPRLLHADVHVAAREMVRSMVAMHAVNPRLHKVLVEQVPRVGRLERIDALTRHATDLTRAYLEHHAAELRVTDLDMAAFIVVHTVEALTHFAVLTRQELLSDAFVDQVTDLLVRYLRADKKPPISPRPA